MSRVLITGSAQGLGLLAARRLIQAGHEVVLHARNPARSRDTSAAAPGASAVVVGDLASIEQTRQIAEQANATGRFDAVIHNAGVYLEPQRVATADGLAHVFAVNVLAPYLLTALIPRPERLVYLTSGMQHGGNLDLDDLQWTRRRWNASQAYAESKLLDVALAFRHRSALAGGAVQRRRPRMGADQDGRPVRDRRPRGGRADPGLASYRRRPWGLPDRPLPVPPPPAIPPPRRRRPRRPGSPARHLRRSHRDTAAMTSPPSAPPWQSAAAAGRG